MKIILKCNRFIELLGCKNLFFIFNILPPGFFFENRTFKWVALIGFWIKFILFLHFAPNETTRVGNSLIRSSLFCSKLLILKSDCEQFAQIAHEKRATVSKLLRLLTKNEQLWAICSERPWVKGRSGQKSNLSQSFVFSEWIALSLTKNEWFTKNIWKKSYFCKFKITSDSLTPSF